MRATKRYDPKLYDSRYYERVAAWSQSEKYHLELQALLNYLKLTEKDTVLDVGCGTGQAMRYITARCHCKILGLDFPPGWIRPLDLIGPADLEGFVRADAGSLPFADATFSKLLLIHVIGHLPDPGIAFREIRRVLRPRGRCGIITPNSFAVRWYRFLNKLGVLAHRPDPTVLRLFSPGQLAELLRSAGFRAYFLRYQGSLPSPARQLQRYFFGTLERLRERLICVAEKD